MATSVLANQALLAASKDGTEWPEDAQIYQPTAGQLTLPDQARCYGIEAILRLQNLKYDLVPKTNAEFISPSGRVPLLRMDDDVIGEESIMTWLQTKGFSLINQLPDAQKLEAKSLVSLFEMTLIPAELYCTWIDPHNCKETMESYGSVYPQPLKFILTHKKKAAVKSTLKVLGWANKTMDDVAKELKTVFTVASVKLDSNVFLTGDSPNEADALLFGHLQAMLRTTQCNKMLVQALENHPELVRYCVAIGKLCGFAAQ
eukprot:Seg1012.8 transcript_id=Seg1012.8/GoldUCD/mRNA.D3Y31 product=Metaxin-2 protein_id=Seg1012.8/GoldUCD/D3Y31